MRLPGQTPLSTTVAMNLRIVENGSCSVTAALSRSGL